MIGRIVRAADFERALRLPPCARSTHFALHHLPAKPESADLSTGQDPIAAEAVDESTSAGLLLGSVVPKRHARRAVTRNLIKRQIRAAVERHAPRLPAGWWVVRLKAPFDAARFASAASAPLRATARAELDAMLQRAPGQP